MIYLAGAMFVSCSKGDFGMLSGERDGAYVYGESAGAPDSGGGDGGSQNGGAAGKVTAGEWCDLHNWCFWSNLMTCEPNEQDQENRSEGYTQMSSYWGFYTNNRVAVKTVDEQDHPVGGVKVSLERNGSVIWSTYSDNVGEANCWVSMFQEEENADAGTLTIVAGGERISDGVILSSWNTTEEVTYNKIVVKQQVSRPKAADIAFIVDATGSMMDEINFLKADLLDILNTTSQLQSDISFRTAALFYRDEGDTYLTRESDFSSFKTTTDFIKKQSAGGGGDYPEAVHTALEKSLQKLSWGDNNRTKLAFMLLDAPAHHEEAVLKSLHQSIKTYADKGIKLIPVAASGVDKSTEFMLRFFAIATGGTYVFITNDSGIGNDHIAATVGEYQVELLNELLIRLIRQYTE